MATELEIYLYEIDWYRGYFGVDIMADVGFESLIRQLRMKLTRQEASVVETKAQLVALEERVATDKVLPKK